MAKHRIVVRVVITTPEEITKASAKKVVEKAFDALSSASAGRIIGYSRGGKAVSVTGWSIKRDADVE